MIHSLAGGNLGKEKFLDFALVEILDEPFKENKFWYLSKVGLKKGDNVLVSLKGVQTKGQILRIDKNVSSYASPIPVKMAKEIIKKV